MAKRHNDKKIGLKTAKMNIVLLTRFKSIRTMIKISELV